MKKLLAMLCVISLMLLSGCGGTETKRSSKDDIKKYTAQSEFLFSNGNIGDGNSATNEDIAASINFLPTIRDICKSFDLFYAIREPLEEYYGLDISFEEWKEAVSFENEKMSFLISVIVETESQEKSKKILKCISEVLPEYIEEKIVGVEVVFLKVE